MVDYSNLPLLFHTERREMEREGARERYGYEFFISVPPEVEVKTTALFIHKQSRRFIRERSSGLSL